MDVSDLGLFIRRNFALITFHPGNPAIVRSGNPSAPDNGLAGAVHRNHCGRIVGQIQRYRHHSTEIHRQQTKWVLFGLAVATFVIPICGYIGYAFPPTEPSLTRLRLLFGATPLIPARSLMAPLTVAFSLLRHRRFDIDKLIQRTLVYTIFTGLLAAIYFLPVILRQNVFAAFRRSSPFTPVFTTLGIAAQFNPLRKRVQALIDRIFY